MIGHAAAGRSVGLADVVRDDEDDERYPQIIEKIQALAGHGGILPGSAIPRMLAVTANENTVAIIAYSGDMYIGQMGSLRSARADPWTGDANGHAGLTLASARTYNKPRDLFTSPRKDRHP